MKTNFEVRSDLDEKIKTIYSLLQRLPNEERIEYIKAMIPSLIAEKHDITNQSQRLAEKHLTPFNTLSAEQRKTINELGDKTEYLYNLINGSTT